jgi:hypothetical protein
LERAKRYTDRAETVDFVKLARVTSGLRAVVEELAVRD